MLTLRISRCVSTLPPANGSWGEEVARGPDGQAWGYGQTTNREFWLHLPNWVSFCFVPGSSEVTAFPARDQTSDRIADLFQRCAQPYVLQALGREVLHASAVRAPAGVVAFCGHSMSGKSTLAYGLSRHGFPQWADDFVVFDRVGGRILALPVAFQSRLRPDSAAFFGRGENGTPASNGAEAPANEPVPLVALYLLQRHAPLGGQRLPSTALTPSLAFPALLAHAYCFSLQNTERKRRMVQRYLDLSAEIPVRMLTAPARLQDLPDLAATLAPALNALAPPGKRA